jgi:hypothetical protein
MMVVLCLESGQSRRITASPINTGAQRDLVRDPAYRCAWVATRIIGTEVPRPDCPIWCRITRDRLSTVTTPATAVSPTASTHPGRHPEPDEGPGLTWRETGANYWSGSSGSQPRGTVMLETSGLWVAYLRLEDPAGLSPITTVGRFDTAEEAQVATDEMWAAR